MLYSCLLFVLTGPEEIWTDFYTIVLSLVFLQDVESGADGSSCSFHFENSAARIQNGNHLGFETKDTVVTANGGSSAKTGNGAVCVQPVSSRSSRKNSANPFLDPSKRNSSVDMKGKIQKSLSMWQRSVGICICCRLCAPLIMKFGPHLAKRC